MDTSEGLVEETNSESTEDDSEGLITFQDSPTMDASEGLVEETNSESTEDDSKGLIGFLEKYVRDLKSEFTSQYEKTNQEEKRTAMGHEIIRTKLLELDHSIFSSEHTIMKKLAQIQEIELSIRDQEIQKHNLRTEHREGTRKLRASEEATQQKAAEAFESLKSLKQEVVDKSKKLKKLKGYETQLSSGTEFCTETMDFIALVLNVPAYLGTTVVQYKTKDSEGFWGHVSDWHQLGIELSSLMIEYRPNRPPLPKISTCMWDYDGLMSKMNFFLEEERRLHQSTLSEEDIKDLNGCITEGTINATISNAWKSKSTFIIKELKKREVKFLNWVLPPDPNQGSYVVPCDAHRETRYDRTRKEVMCKSCYNVARLIRTHVGMRRNWEFRCTANEKTVEETAPEPAAPGGGQVSLAPEETLPGITDATAVTAAAAAVRVSPSPDKPLRRSTRAFKPTQLFSPGDVAKKPSKNRPSQKRKASDVAKSPPKNRPSQKRKASDVAKSPGDAVGDDGAKSPGGAVGDAGAKSPGGAVGDAGAKSPVGAVGDAGAKSPVGAVGDAGATGVYETDWERSTLYTETKTIATWLAHTTNDVLITTELLKDANKNTPCSVSDVLKLKPKHMRSRLNLILTKTLKKRLEVLGKPDLMHLMHALDSSTAGKHILAISRMNFPNFPKSEDRVYGLTLITEDKEGQIIFRRGNGKIQPLPADMESEDGFRNLFADFWSEFKGVRLLDLSELEK
jgi:hypothetical protein